MRSGLEFSSPLWSNALTKQKLNRLERVQAQMTNLILGPNELNYMNRLAKLSLPKLEDRFKIISDRFSDKMVKDSRFKSLFPKNTSSVNTRNRRPFVEKTYRTNRMMSSAIPSFIRSQNEKHQAQT